MTHRRPRRPAGARPAGTGAGTDTAPRAVSGSGSGFIVSADGLILTSAHVVDDATDVTVRLTDRREFKATVLAVDPQSDVAVLRVNATKLPFVRVGDSSKVRAGEPVMTIGAPDGSGNTVTAGIVSATSHRLPDGSAFRSSKPTSHRTPTTRWPRLQSGRRRDRHRGAGLRAPTATRARRSRSRSRLPQRCVQLQKQMQAQAQQAQAPGESSSGNAIGVDVQDVGIGLAAAFGLPPGGRASSTASRPARRPPRPA